MGNPISQGYGGPLVFESATVYVDHVALVFSSPPTLTGAAAVVSNWTIIGTPASSTTSVVVVGSTINVYFTPQLNGQPYTINIPAGIVDGTGYPAVSPAFYAYTAIGQGPTIIGIEVVDARLIEVLFDKAVNTVDAVDLSKWSVDNGLSLIVAVMVGLSQVNIITSKQVTGTTYTLTATGIRDLAGNPS